METKIKKTWKPTVAGILNIVNGSLKLIFSLFLVLFAQGLLESAESGRTDVYRIGSWIISPSVIWGSVVLLTVLGILAIAGGIYALQRKRWSWVLSGSIAALIPCVVMGTLAIIFTSLSKDEFE